MTPETNTQPDTTKEENVGSAGLPYYEFDVSHTSSKLASKIEEFDGQEVSYYTHEGSGDKVVVAKTQFMGESIYCLFVRSRYPHPQEDRSQGEMRVDFKLRQAFGFMGPNERKLIHERWSFQLQNPYALGVFRFYDSGKVTFHIADRHDEGKVRYHDFAEIEPSLESMQTLDCLIDMARPVE